MEAEVATQIGAQLGERAPERLTHRNGYRSRTWDTRVGEVELASPRLGQGSYFPSFLEPGRRAEQALVAVVQEAYQEAYINGVSDAAGGPAGRAARHQQHEQGPGLQALPRAGRPGPRLR
jgi:Transposase, Mutator family